MSRIRSIHPGIYTDEDWASVGIAARWLCVGLMTLADDHGVFEWKPLQIKMTIFPADAVDATALLTELAEAGRIRSFESGGKRYGAIRNFMKYQRPRKPKTWHPILDGMKEFVGMGSEPVADEVDAVPQKSELDGSGEVAVPPSSGMSPQREDGGGRRDDGKGIDNLQEQQHTIPAAAPALSENETEEIQRRCEQAAGRGFAHFQTILTLVDQGVDLDRRILPIIRDVVQACTRQGKDPPTSWKYFEPAILDHGRPIKGLPSRPAVDLDFIEEGTTLFEQLMAGPKASFWRKVTVKHPETGRRGIYRKKEAA